MVPEYVVHALRLGTIKTVKSATVLGVAPDPIEIPIWAAAIEGNGRKLLVDTGIRDAEKWSDISPHILEPGETLDARLAELGWTTRDIEIVVNSHLHYDHAENNLLLPHAQFYVSRAEWEFANDPGGQANLYNIDWTGPDLTYMNYTLIATDHYDVLPGVRVIQTPGHTPGHQSVLVNTAEGVLCVTGDAACLMENFTIPAPPGTHVSSKASLESIDKICGLADQVLMNHDPVVQQYQNAGFPVPPVSGARALRPHP